MPIQQRFQHVHAFFQVFQYAGDIPQRHFVRVRRAGSACTAVRGGVPTGQSPERVKQDGQTCSQQTDNERAGCRNTGG